MPSFDSRYKELTRRLEDAKPKLKPEEITRIQAAISTIDQTRHSALTDVTSRLEDGGTGEHQGPVRSSLANAWAAIDPPLENMLSGVTDPSEAALAFRNRTIVEEMRFWTALQAVDMGGAYDEIRKHADNITQMLEVLRAKWDTIAGTDADVLSAEKAATAKLLDILKRGSENAASTKAEALKLVVQVNEQIRSVAKRVNEEVKTLLMAAGVPEGVADFICSIGKPGKQAIDINEDYNGIPAGDTAKQLIFHVGDSSFRIMDAGAWTADALKVAIKGVGLYYKLDPELVSAMTFSLGRLSDAIKDASVYLQQAYYDQVRAVRDLFPRQDAILVTFSQTRRDADDFIKNRDLEDANTRYDKLCSDLDHLHGDPPSDGFKGDLDEMGELVVKALHERLAEVEEDYKSFVSWNMGRLIGDKVSPELRDKLLDSASFDQVRFGIKAFSLPDNLKWWRDGVTALTPQFGDAFTQFNDVLDKLPFEVSGPIAQQLNDWQAKVQSQLSQIANDARAASDSGLAIISNDQVDKDLDRRALEERVP